jgi:hypothetical protein
MVKAKRDPWTVGLVAGTAAWTLGALWLLWGAKLFRPGGHFLALEELDHLGSFLSGFLTPVAVAWAARSLFLQREQMFHAMQDMARQRDDQIRERLEASDPNIQIVRGMIIQSAGHRNTMIFELKNHGAIARRFTVAFRFRYRQDGTVASQGELVFTQDLPGAHGAINFDVNFPLDRALQPAELTAMVLVHAQRLDGKVSRFLFRSPQGAAQFESERETAVPGLTMDMPLVLP